jgi:hypothetical protein
MDIAIIQDDQIVEIGHYKKLFPATSFPTTGPDVDFMAANNVLGVTIWKAHDKTTQKLITVDPYIEDNQVFTVAVTDKTPEDIAADTLAVANEVRAKRNQLLLETDWTQVADVQVDKVIWAEYRQALRDITLQEGFPFDIIWPSQHKSIPVESSIPTEVPVNIPEEISIPEEPVIDIPAGSSDSIDSINIL